MQITQKINRNYGRKCVLVPGDLRDEKLSTYIVDTAIKILEKLIF